jgi:hypothetical protein
MSKKYRRAEVEMVLSCNGGLDCPGKGAATPDWENQPYIYDILQHALQYFTGELVHLIVRIDMRVASRFRG